MQINQYIIDIPAQRLLLIKECKWQKLETLGWETHTSWASCCCRSVAKLCPTPCHPVHCNMPGSSVHELPVVAQIHVHWVNDAIWSLPLLLLPSIFPSIRVFFLMSELFISGGQNIRASASASVLPVNIQDWFPLGLTGWIPLLSKGLSRVFSNTTIWKHQFFCTQLPLWSSFHICTWLLGNWKTIAFTIWAFVS